MIYIYALLQSHLPFKLINREKSEQKECSII